MASEVLINAGAGEIRVARVVEGRLEEYFFERILGGGAAHQVGDIILGRVQRVMPGMQAAFVEIGQTKAGFLALREARILARAPAEDTGISDCVREGEAILVQVIKDPIGEKGARLSAGITLPGRLLVMTPGQPGMALSRRIEDEDSRAALTEIGKLLLQEARLPPGAGFIFRTAAAGASFEDLVQDALGLHEIWRGIDDKRKSARPPAILYHDLGPIERTLRDVVRGDVTRVLIDDSRAAEAARAYCRHVSPKDEILIESAAGPVFERHGLEDEIAGLSRPRVGLPSGGWITIETTEALTAIDVNSGSYAASSALEETGYFVNLEAAREIGRQLRLRGIGGLIVADFIQMMLPQHREAVLAALTTSLGQDGTAQISAMSEFGIVAITRKRVRESLARLTSESCATCAGTGRTPTPETLGQEILRRVEREARAWPGRELLVTAPPPVAAWLNAHGAAEALAQRGTARARFEAGAMTGEAFNVQPI